MTAGIISLLIIIVTSIVSYKGFNDHFFFQKYEFGIDKVRLYKDYKVLVTSGFLHINWMHLIFNMLALYFFSGGNTNALEPLQFLLVYFGSLIGGNLLSLLIYKNQGDYTAVGASGAVCGIIFAAIALVPGMRVGLFFIPIPGWLFGLLYVAYSIYGVRSKRDNIGHEAHLGGGLVGMAIALLLRPQAFLLNYITILIISVPAIIFIYLIITRPHILLVDNLFYTRHKNYYSVDHKYNEGKFNQQKEIDKILDKISKRGINSLSQKEKKMLEDYSKNS